MGRSIMRALDTPVPSPRYYKFLTKIQISPDQRFIVSVGAEGAIFLWNTPMDVFKAKPESELPTISKEVKSRPAEKAPSQPAAKTATNRSNSRKK